MTVRTSAGIAVQNNELRPALMDAARLWGTIELKHNPSIARRERLRIRAYAEAYGIAFDDRNDGTPDGPLTPEELAFLPALRSEARAGHLGEIVVFRIGLKANQALRLAASGAGKVLRPLSTTTALIVFLTLAGMYVLLGIACGFASPVDFTNFLIGWARAHPHELWHYARVAAGLGLLMWVFLIVVVFCNYLDALDKRQTRPAHERRYEIENFREQNPYGDASLAERARIARALGIRSDPSPQFED
jgi:hypothetical protein